MQSQTIRPITSALAAFYLHRHATRRLSTRPLRLSLLLSLMFLAGLAGCGPASSDKSPNLGPRASEGVVSPGSPASLALGNGAGSASGRRTISGRDNTAPRDRQLPKPADTPNGKTNGVDQSPVPIVPGIPDSIVKDLDSPDARVRLQAMNHWGVKGTMAPLDPLFEALEDEDEAVRAKATEIIEQRFATEQAQRLD